MIRTNESSSQIVSFVWELKRDFEEMTGQRVYWTFTIGEMDGSVCTLVTLGINGKFVVARIKNGFARDISWWNLQKKFQRIADQYLLTVMA